MQTPYIGETKFKICSRGDQHRKNVIQNKIDYSGTTQHSQKCDQCIEWESLPTLKVENNKFDRKVREALEIQYHQCGPKKGGMNFDDDQYVNTKFWTPCGIGRMMQEMLTLQSHLLPIPLHCPVTVE